MDIVTLLTGIVVVFIGKRQELAGAGLPLIAGGVCLILFGGVWVLAKRFNAF